MDHLQVAYNATGVLPEGLKDLPEMPASLVNVWGWFLELHGARTSNGGGGWNPIGYTDIQNWAILSGVRISHYELTALRAIDREFIASG